MTTQTISAQVEDYLALRRAMGFELRGEGYQLRAFSRFVSEQGEVDMLTIDLLLRWVQGAATPGPVTAARRVEVLRPFLKYRRQFDPGCPVIPVDHCGPGHRRLSPHIYTEEEVVALLAAASELKPDGLRPLTYVTLFGLLASTGLRLSEALNLKRTDLNLEDHSSLTIRETKFKKSRLVPIHVSTAKVLSDYQRATVGVPHQQGVETIFLGAKGHSIPKRTVHDTFDHLRRRLGWVARGSHPQPRIHDLRHTFICKALLRGQRDNQLDRVTDAISTYVGHAKVSDTYWYISATPALMNEASQRFFRFCLGGGQ
jgi:integrase